MTRQNIHDTVYLVGTGIVAALAYILANYPRLSPEWRSGIGAVVAGMSVAGALWMKPPSQWGKQTPAPGDNETT